MAELFSKFISASTGKGFKTGSDRDRFRREALGPPAKVGLTGEAQQTQGLTDSTRRRRRFETVFAGETGTVQTGKLGLTGRI